MGGCISKKGLNKREFLTSDALAADAALSSCSSVKPSFVRLFGRENCLDTARIRIVLQHKGVGVDLVWISSESIKGNNAESLLISFTGGKFPLLQHEDNVLCNSTSEILDYIDKTFPHPSLTRTEIHVEAQQEWIDYIQDDFTALILRTLTDGSPYIQQDIAPKLDEAFSKLDSGIAEYCKRGPFFMGQYFSLIDAYLIPTLELLSALKYFRGIEMNATSSSLKAYISRLRSFPSYVPVKMHITHVETAIFKTIAEKSQPAILCMAILQHRSIRYHLQHFIEFADELIKVNQGPKVINPVKGSFGMQIKKFGKTYDRLIELLQEHAQMEEIIVFPRLEDADKGVTKAVTSHHARDLPAMNGIREDVKACTSIEKGTPNFNVALDALTLRLRAFQEHTSQHFQEEERELLPLLAAAGLGNKQQEALVVKCVELMEATHGHLLPYFLQGLQPHEVHQYMLIMQKCSEDGKLFMRLMQTVKLAEDEFESVRKEVGERMLCISSTWGS